MADRITRPHLRLLAALLAGFGQSFAASELADGIEALPTPWVIAHRGGLLLWPEGTMEAYQASTAAGNNFVEVDCALLKDGAVGIIHDYTLERTTTGVGEPRLLTAVHWGKIQVDGQKMLGPGWGKYRLPFLDEVLVKYRNHKIIFAEAKTGNSGRAIVEKLKTYRVSKKWVVINSFIEKELTVPISAGYLTCLNLQNMDQSAASLKRAGYWGVACPNPVTEEYIKSLKAAGLRVFGYTINRHHEREKLLRWGVDGFYTDDPLYMGMKGDYRRNTDPYSMQKWSAGMLAGLDGDRGFFVAPNKWAVNAAKENRYKGCLQGWMSPIGGNIFAPEWSMELSITFGPRYQDDRWASVAVFDTDAALNADASSALPLFGFQFLFHNTGGITIYRYGGQLQKAPVLEKSIGGPKILEGETVNFRITTTAGSITAERTDGKATLVIKDNTYRGGYVTFGAKGQYAEFSNVRLRIP